MKYKIWLDEWFANYIQPSSKAKTCEKYSEIIEKHLKVKLGEYELDELTPLALQRYVTELLKGGNIVTGKGLSAVEPSAEAASCFSQKESVMSVYLFSRSCSL